jgi:hypothetical protein
MHMVILAHTWLQGSAIRRGRSDRTIRVESMSRGDDAQRDEVRDRPDRLAADRDGKGPRSKACVSADGGDEGDLESCLSKAGTPIMHNSPERPATKTRSTPRIWNTFGDYNISARITREANSEAHATEYLGRPSSLMNVGKRRNSVGNVTRDSEGDAPANVLRSTRGIPTRIASANKEGGFPGGSALRKMLDAVRSAETSQAGVWDMLSRSGGRKDAAKTASKEMVMRHDTGSTGSVDDVQRQSDSEQKDSQAASEFEHKQASTHDSATMDENFSMESWLKHISNLERQRRVVGHYIPMLVRLAEE